MGGRLGRGGGARTAERLARRGDFGFHGSINWGIRGDVDPDRNEEELEGRLVKSSDEDNGIRGGEGARGSRDGGLRKGSRSALLGRYGSRARCGGHSGRDGGDGADPQDVEGVEGGISRFSARKREDRGADRSGVEGE